MTEMRSPEVVITNKAVQEANEEKMKSKYKKAYKKNKPGDTFSGPDQTEYEEEPPRLIEPTKLENIF